MNYVEQLVDGVNAYFDLNLATLSGAIDIIVVEQPDGSLKSTPFHVRFGKIMLLRARFFFSLFLFILLSKQYLSFPFFPITAKRLSQFESMTKSMSLFPSPPPLSHFSTLPPPPDQTLI